MIRAGEELYLSSHFGRAPCYAIVRLESSRECSVLEVLEKPLCKARALWNGESIEYTGIPGISVAIVLGMVHSNGLGKTRSRYTTLQVNQGELIPLKRAIELHINNQLEETSEREN